MPTPRLIASPVLEPKKIRAISLFHTLPHTVKSYHVNQPTQARIIDPEPVKSKLTRFGKRKLRCNFRRNDSFSNFSLPLIFRAIFYYARGDTVHFHDFLLTGFGVLEGNPIDGSVNHSAFRDFEEFCGDFVNFCGSLGYLRA